MYAFDMGIGLDDRIKLLLGKIMDFRIGKTLLDTADYRCGKHDITDGTKAYDEDFLQSVLIFLIKSKNY